MDIYKSKIVQSSQSVQGSPQTKTGEYIPTLHTNNQDSVELSSSENKKEKTVLGNLINKIKNFVPEMIVLIGFVCYVVNKIKESDEGIAVETQPNENSNQLVNDIQQVEDTQDFSVQGEIQENINIENHEVTSGEEVSVDVSEKILTSKSKEISRDDILEKLNAVDKSGYIKYQIDDALDTPERIMVADLFLSEPSLYENEGLQRKIRGLIRSIKTTEQLQIATKFLSDPNLYENQELQNKIVLLISYSNTTEQLNIVEKFFSDPELFKNEWLQKNIEWIIDLSNAPEKINLVEKFLSDPKLHKNESIQCKIADVLCNRDTIDCPQAHIILMDKYISVLDKYCDSRLNNNIGEIIFSAHTMECAQAKIRVIDKFLSDSDLYESRYLKSNFPSILTMVNNTEIASFVEKIFSDSRLYGNDDVQDFLIDIITNAKKSSESVEAKIKLIDKFLSNSNIYDNTSMQDNIGSIISFTKTIESADFKIRLIDKFFSNPNFYLNKGLQENIGSIVGVVNSLEKATLLDKFLSDPKFYENEGLQKKIASIIYTVYTPESITLVDIFLSDPKLYENEGLQKKIASIIEAVNTPEKVTLAHKLLDDIHTGETTPEVAISTIENYGKVSYKQLQKLKKTIGSDLFNKIYNKSTDVVAAANLIGLFGKNNINEISITEKRNVLRAIVKSNTDLFNVSSSLKQAFPLIPKNKEEYCALLPSLVKSLGIEVKALEESQVQEFNADLNNLGSSLAQLSDDEFNNLEISNTYSKDEFINDTLSILEGLPDTEKQKVYDYFGFELHHNKKASTGYSIEGYPVNINNGAKLAQITDEKTKQVVEQLRPKVVMFSETNTIQSNNEKVAEQLNEILEKLPELRSTIGRNQFGAHEFDVMKHSLKVMQKITQNPSYQKLDESDKKLMLLASLLHDISKAEIKPDPTHNFESSFDAFYIAKKFNLTKEEEIKLYTLINHHEWLKYVNKDGLSEYDRTKRLQSVAFDLQNDNLFEMSKIFTEADLKGIDGASSIYDKYGSALEKHSKKVEEYIGELKKTKPILPTTKLPQANDIRSKITSIKCSDGSTNLKGVYIVNDLVVIKYNEVEDWESLGFPEGTVSKGIDAYGYSVQGDKEFKCDVNTGNIKFIAHSLDYENQLSNFDAFALPDSDALLSVSYMERPESKYRLFRSHGVLLDVDSKYIYGGGKTDTGSGYEKDINNFKKYYIFGGVRQSDRNYISSLIKETLNLTDEEYVEFIEANQNKSMLEIEPVEARKALIKKFSEIKSNIREGNREYNEMYVSNPKVQGCFAYSAKDEVGNITDFIHSQPEFLTEYAKENNLPFFVFGD